MRTQITVTDPAGESARDFLVEADPGTPTTTVLQSIATACGDLPAGFRSVGGDDSVPWAASGILEGTVLNSTGPIRILPRPQLPHQLDGGVLLRVVGGSGAGTILQLGPGKAVIGSDPLSTIQVADPQTPLVAAVLEVTLAEKETSPMVTISRGHAEVQLTLNGEDVTGTVIWPMDGLLRVSDTLYQLAPHVVRPASLQASEEGGKLDFNRPPRLFPPSRATRFKLPSVPAEESRRSLPLLMATAPLVLALGMVLITGRPAYLLFGFLSPVMLIANYYSSKKSGKISHRERVRKYQDTKRDLEADARAALVAFEEERRLLSPDPATAAVIATTPTPRLWERRRTDPDHLTIRLGVSIARSDVVLEDPEQLEHKRQVTWEAHDVPVVVPLTQRGVLGLCGPEEQIRTLAGWVVAQLAVVQSPRDLRLYLLAPREGRRNWEWLRWLPHARPSFGENAVSLIGSDSSSTAQRISELLALIAERSRARSAAEAFGSGAPDVVIILDGAHRLRGWPGIAQILADGPSVGVYAVCLDTEERFLPEQCDAVLAPAASGRWLLRQQREHDVDDVLIDRVPPAWFDWVARALAPIRDAGDDREPGLPAAARLLDVIDMEPPRAEAVVQRWHQSPRTTEAILGVNLDGPFTVDLRRDGPHVLIGGTTGSGKSELLQTLVASLALANRPDALSFVLIDYKGAAAFKDCADLPHTVGMVTDLDAHLVRRAIQSLAAELRRREHLLAEAGAKDIEDYTVLTDRDESLHRMPRLMIVIDEFAAMKSELPDFIDGVVNVAQRGRSLGIHLVLATQRPSGAISPEIRANTNLRIALRVSYSADSQDILATADAARISQDTPGRGFMRSGSAPLVPFQTARIAGRRSGAVAGMPHEPRVHPLPWEALGAPVPWSAEHQEHQGWTDLMMLVASIRQAAEQLGTPVQHSPWLPPLPPLLTLAELAVSNTYDSQRHAPERALTGSIPPVAFGLEDRPEEQSQHVRTIDFAMFSHLYICGSARSGRSQALRTIAGSIAGIVTVDDVHLYGIDFGSGALQPLSELPHCGTVATRLQTDRVIRLLDRLIQEMGRRQQLLAEAGYAGITEQRRQTEPKDRLPHVVLLFDQWEGLVATMGDSGGSAVAERIMIMLREGAPAGIHLIISGDKQLLGTRMSSLVEEKLILRFSDRNDHSLAGLQPRSIPDSVPDGRCFSVGRGLETQLAVLSEDLSGRGQAEALRSIAKEAKHRLRERPSWHRPFSLRALPASISFEDAWNVRQHTDSPCWALLGAGGDELAGVGVDLATTPGFVIAGVPRSGKSTMLHAMAESLRRQDVELVVLTPRNSALQGLSDRPGVRRVISGPEITVEVLQELNSGSARGFTLVIDDAELVDDRDVQGWLRSHLRERQEGRHVVLAAGDIDSFGGSISSWVSILRAHRQGALLGASSVFHGGVLGVTLDKEHLAQQVPTGRALIYLGDGAPRWVQVPFL